MYSAVPSEVDFPFQRVLSAVGLKLILNFEVYNFQMFVLF